MPATRKAYYGNTASPSIDPFGSIQVRSVNSYGDADNAGTTNYSNARANIFWGWPGGTGAQYRVIPIWKIALSGVLPVDATIGRAIMRLGLCGRVNYSSYTFPGTWRFAIHELETAVGSGMDYNNSQTALDWLAPGNYGPAPDYDYVSDAAGYFDVDSTLWGSLTNYASNSNALTIVQFIEIDITDVVKRAYLAGSNLQLIAPVPFAKPPGGGGSGTADNLGLLFDNPANAAFSADDHSHLRIEYYPTLGILGNQGDLTGRPPNFNNLHDPAMPGLINRTYVGAIEIGSVGTAKKLFANNYSSDGQRKLVVIGTGRSEARVVDNSDSVSGNTLRSIDVYDNNSTGSTPTELTVSGDLILEPQSGTTYKLYFTPTGGAGGYLLEDGTGLSTVSFAADHVFVYSSKKFCKIRTAKFSATTGWSTSDRIRCAVDGDQRTNTQSVDTLKLIQVCPPTAVNGDTASTSEARPLYNAFTQQLRSAVANVLIGSDTHGHIEVRDTITTGWKEGELLTLFTADGLTLATATLEAIFSPTNGVLAGSYADTLRINRAFTGPELAAFDANASVTGGLFLGAMAAFEVRRLGAAAASGSGTLALNEAFTGTPSVVMIIDTSVSPSIAETHNVDSGSSTLVLDDFLDQTFSQGSLVINVIDGVATPNLASFRSYFAFGDIPSTQDMGLYSNYYKLFEHQLA